MPVNHWAYDFLERLEAQRILPVLLSSTKPMTRQEIVDHLAPVLSSDSLLNRLSAVQRQQLAYLSVEFQEELAQRQVRSRGQTTELQKLVRHPWIDPWLPNAIYANGRNFLSVYSYPFQLYFDPIFKRQRTWNNADSLAKTEKVFENGNGFRLWGTVGSVGFAVDVRDHQEWGTRHYPGIVNYTKERLGFVRGNAKGLDHDETNAYLLYQYKYFHLAFGKEVNRWGPGYFGQLALSDYPTSYDQLKFALTGRRIRFTHVTAVLQHYNDKFFENGHVEKYLVGHRLEFAPLTWLDFGLHETIVYADRKFEAGYLNPIMFYRSAEHYLGDRDNATMGLDVEILAGRGIKIYGELFIDDLTTSKLSTDFYGNKYGYTFGGLTVNPFGLADLDLRAEYTAIRPYTYDHSGTTGYWHYRTLLGHWLGPNSTSVFAEAIYRFSQPFCFKVSGRMIRHGANRADQNAGGDPFVSRNFDKDPENVRLLGGLLQKSDQLAFFSSYEFLRNYFFQIEWRYSKYHRETTEQRVMNGISRQWTLWFSVNY